MKVLIVGANGGIGRILSKKMTESEDLTPVAMIRKEEQRSFFDEIGVDTKIGDLQDPVASLKKMVDGHDAVVFTAGSGAKTGYDKTLEIDLDAAVKCMKAAEEAGVHRFLIVSAMNADDRESWNSSPIKPYMIAKHYADHFLKESSLEYTILRPGRLTEEEGTGCITLEPASQDHRDIAREDVATTIIECLRSKNSVGKTYEFIRGEQPIREVVS